MQSIDLYANAFRSKWDTKELRSEDMHEKNLFLIFLTVLVSGIFLASFASAQPNQMPGQIDQSSFAGVSAADGSNLAPRISNLTPDKPGPQEAGTSIKWTVAARDSDDDVLLYMFRLNGPSTGGRWRTVSGWSPENAWEWYTSNEDIGDNQIAAWVRDGKHANADGFDDQMIQDYQITQPETQVVAGQGASQEQNFVPPVNVPGQEALQLSGQQTASDVTAPANQPPVMMVLTSNLESPQEAGAVVTWMAQATDMENDPLQFLFSIDGQSVTDWQDNPTWTWTTTASDVGSHTVEVRVRDNRHTADGDDSRTASFTITAPNQKPSIASLVSDKASPQEAGSVITWTAQASDPEGDPIAYRFILNGQPVTDWQPQNQFVWTSTDSNVGENQLEVRILDGKHADQESFDDSRTASFTITAPNQKPSIASLVSDKASPQEAGSVITWTAQASDPEGDPIAYRFLLNGTPVTDWQTQNQWSWTANEVGASQIQVQVKDDKHDLPEGAGGNMSAEFIITAPEAKAAEENVTAPAVVQPGNVTLPSPENITAPVAENVTQPLVPANVTEPAAPVAQNQTPVLDALVPDKTSPQTPGTTIIWTANATDADLDAILFRFFHKGPATGGSWEPETEWSETSTWTWSTSSADAGENQVRVWIRDGKHAGEDSFDAEQSAYFSLIEPVHNISGSAFNDKNGNGQLDGGEALAGWTIKLVKPDNSEVSTMTKDDGSYRFEQLSPGSYTVSEALPSGWNAINPESGSYTVDLKDADVTGKDFANRLTSYSIFGMKFNDLNGNGANDGEPGMQGWTIQLSKDGSIVSTTTTGQDGSYKFESLEPGSYTVAEVEQSGWTRTAPKEGSYLVELKDSDVSGKDFGNHGSWSISGTVFKDLNGDGARGTDEIGLAGWNVQLAKEGSVVNVTATGQDGSYKFESLAPGTYTVSEGAQEGWAQTVPQGAYTVDLKDADVIGKDFGNRGNFTISSKKFYDLNGNGVQDEDEPALPGQEVKLVKDGKEIAKTTTDSDGSFTFSNLEPGTYEVDDPIVVTVSVKSVIVGPIPVTGSYAISGTKYKDFNGNGALDSVDKGEPNWEIVLTGPDWLNPVPSRTIYTDSNGFYKFTGLLHGKYTVKEVARPGWTLTSPASGSYSVTFALGEPSREAKKNDFYNQPSERSISGVKYNDLNGNGKRDPGEPGVKDWTINLEQPAGTKVKTATTGADGSYIFEDLAFGDWVVSEDLQSGWSVKEPASGSYTVTLSATNPVATGKNFGNFNNNLPPKDPTLVPDKGSPQKVGTPIVWTAGATDPDGDALQFRFFVKGPSTGEHMQPQTDWTSSGTWTWSTGVFAPGSYQVEVWIRDGKHAGPESFDVKKTVSFALTSTNHKPVVNVLFADRPAPQFAGSWIKWTALASDPEGDPLQYKFYLRGPSTGGFWVDQTGWGKNNRWIWRTNPLDVGYSEVLVAVRDGKHAGPAGSDDYDIASYFIVNLNQPPVITSIGTSAPSPQPVGATIQWRATAADREGNPVFYRYWLKGPSTGGLWRLVRDWSTDPTWTWPTSLADVGTSEVQVQVRDGLHASPTGWDDDAGALFTVLLPNQPPKLVSLQADRPSPQSTGTLVRWTAVASDPDGEPVLYKFWLKGPSTGNVWVVAQDWSTKNQWTWANAPSDAGAYSVYVYARDGKHAPATGYDSALGAQYMLLSTNQPPKITAFTPDRASPQSAGTTVRWTALASDANFDPILYRFWLKGPSTGNAWKIVQDWSTSNQWVWTSSLADAGSYSVYVYARDGKHAPATGYDSAAGQAYTLNSPMTTKALTTGSAAGTMPSLVFLGDGYLLAYQSQELGRANLGDVALQKLDLAWNKQRTIWVASSRANESAPSLIAAGGNYYVAYTSELYGNREIFVKKYDNNLRLIDTKQLTSSPTNQDSPSLIATGNNFYLAYQSWDTGADSGGDIFLNKYDQNWKLVETVQLTDQKSYQDHPSLAYANGNFYVTYASKESGNLDIFQKKLDENLEVVETKRMTLDRSDQDYPSLKWLNDQFLLLYASKKTGSYDIMLDRYSKDGKLIDSTAAVAAQGDQTSSSMVFSSADRMYWVAYSSKDAAGQNIYVKPLKLTS